jgi:hypothetical protein
LIDGQPRQIFDFLGFELLKLTWSPSHGQTPKYSPQIVFETLFQNTSASSRYQRQQVAKHEALGILQVIKQSTRRKADNVHSTASLSDSVRRLLPMIKPATSDCVTFATNSCKTPAKLRATHMGNHNHPRSILRRRLVVKQLEGMG